MEQNINYNQSKPDTGDTIGYFSLVSTSQFIWEIIKDIIEISVIGILSIPFLIIKLFKK